MSRIKDKHCVYNISYHIVWIPKYRKKILVGELKDRLIYYLFDKATSIGISIEEYEVMSDHIHLFIKGTPTLSISFIVNQLKGYSSFKLRNEFPYLKKYKSLWTNSYFCETIGHISEQTVKKYIRMPTSKKIDLILFSRQIFMYSVYIKKFNE